MAKKLMWAALVTVLGMVVFAASALDEYKASHAKTLLAAAEHDPDPDTKVVASETALGIARDGTNQIWQATTTTDVDTYTSYYTLQIETQLTNERDLFRQKSVLELKAAIGESPSADLNRIFISGTNTLAKQTSKVAIAEYREQTKSLISQQILKESKSAAVAEIHAAVGENPSIAMIQIQYDAESEINAATTTQQVDILKGKWLQAISDQHLLEAKEKANASLVELAGETPWTDTMISAVNTATNFVNQQSSVSNVEIARTSGEALIRGVYDAEVVVERTESCYNIELAAAEKPWSQEVTAAVEAATNAINAATSKTDVTLAEIKGIADVSAIVTKELNQLRETQDTAIIKAAGEEPLTPAMTNAIANATNAVAQAETRSGIQQAGEDGKNAVIELYATELAQEKTEARADIVEAASEEPWSESVSNAVVTATNAVAIAEKKAGVRQAYNTGKSTVAGLVATELSQQKESAIEDLTKAAGEEPWTDAMTQAYANASKAINDATKRSAVAQALEQGKQSLKALYGQELDKEKEDGNAEIIDVAGEKPWIPELEKAVVVATNAVVLTTTKADCREKIAEGKKAVAKARVAYLYPEGDGDFVYSNVARAYVGSLLDAKGAVAGTVEATVYRLAKDGRMRVTVRIHDLMLKYYTYLQDVYKGYFDPTNGFTVAAFNKNATTCGTLKIALSGDSMFGSFSTNSLVSSSNFVGYKIDAVRNVFRTKNDPKSYYVVTNFLDQGRSYGKWTMNLLLNGEKTGALSLITYKSGIVRTRLHLDGQAWYANTQYAQVGDGWAAAPFVFKRTTGGYTYTFGLRTALSMKDGQPQVILKNVGKWTRRDRKTGAVLETKDVKIGVWGKPKFEYYPKAQVKTVYNTLKATGFDEDHLVRRSVAYNSLGIVTGTMAWRYLEVAGFWFNSLGAYVYGVDVNGQIYGSAVFTNKYLTQKVYPLESKSILE